jgi:hypothetical protein
MAIEFRAPSEQDIALMKEFADIVDAGLTVLGKPEIAHVASVIASKLQEALFWYQHGILNKPIAPAAAPVAPVAPEAPASEVTVN